MSELQENARQAAVAAHRTCDRDGSLCLWNSGVKITVPDAYRQTSDAYRDAFTASYDEIVTARLARLWRVRINCLRKHHEKNS